MTAKQYLRRVRKIDNEIESLRRQKRKARESLTSITQNYDGDGAQSTKDPHKFDRLVELESLIDEKINEQLELKAEIIRTIMQIEDSTCRTVLMEYYLEMMTFEQIAVDIHYSWKQTHRIHGRALQAVDVIINRCP